MNVLQSVGIFLVETLFSLYIGAVLIRFLLAVSRANFYNPLSQTLVKITNPALVPLRRLIPAIGKLDTAAIVLALGLIFLKLLLLSLLGTNQGNILLSSLVEFIRSVVGIYIFAMIIQAVMSWMNNSAGNPLADLLHSLTEPVLRPIRNTIPSVGMMDLSPLVAILLLQVVLIVLRSTGL